jgi:hypothetical protein
MVPLDASHHLLSRGTYNHLPPHPVSPKGRPPLLLSLPRLAPTSCLPASTPRCFLLSFASLPLSPLSSSPLSSSSSRSEYPILQRSPPLPSLRNPFLSPPRFRPHLSPPIHIQSAPLCPRSGHSLHRDPSSAQLSSAPLPLLLPPPPT